MPRFLKLPDSFKSGEYFQEELVTKPGGFEVVILDRLVEFLLSYLEKTNLHCLAAVFCENFFKRNGFQRSFLVGSETIFYFLSPNGFDCLIRLIETREKFIDDQRFIGWRET
jgi:hypothetical protein